MLENKLAFIEKELQQAKKYNVALAHYINARRKKEAQNKAEEEARRKAILVAPTSDEGKAPRMSVLGGSSPPRVVQGLPRL
jgi:hypothetical protein